MKIFWVHFALDCWIECVGVIIVVRMLLGHKAEASAGLAVGLTRALIPFGGLLSTPYNNCL